MSGGSSYAASAYGASVRGSTGNKDSGDRAMVSGGHNIVASDSTVPASTGFRNRACGGDPSVNRGLFNWAEGASVSSVRGGMHSKAGRSYASVGCGKENAVVCRSRAVSVGFSDSVHDVTSAMSGCFGK